MTSQQKQAIEAKAEELYPLYKHLPSHTASENYFINNQRKNFIDGATFGLELGVQNYIRQCLDKLKEKDDEIEKVRSALFASEIFRLEDATFGFSPNEWVSVKDETPDEWKIVLASNGTYTYMCEYKMGQFY